MMKTRRLLAPFMIAAAVALGIAGCTAPASTPTESAPPTDLPSDGAAPPAAPPSAAPAGTVLLEVGTVKLADGTEVPALVSVGGAPVYVLSEDSTAAPNCASLDCIAFWPAIFSSDDPALVGAGVTATVTLFESGPGLKQLVIDDRPLFTFGGDPGDGTATGHGLNSNFGGGVWTLLAPDGTLLPVMG